MVTLRKISVDRTGVQTITTREVTNIEIDLRPKGDEIPKNKLIEALKTKGIITDEDLK